MESAVGTETDNEVFTNISLSVSTLTRHYHCISLVYRIFVSVYSRVKYERFEEKLVV